MPQYRTYDPRFLRTLQIVDYCHSMVLACVKFSPGLSIEIDQPKFAHEIAQILPITPRRQAL